MHLPIFTASDPHLMRSDAGRDPLGILPVWSELGRKLVPNIAGPVAQLEGITAVLLIHYLYEKSGAAKDAKRGTFRQYFRLMEGVLEWYLWDIPGGKRHCYGTKALSAGGEFTVTAKDTRTAVNGLYQYYRGTCNRAELLLDGVIAPAVAKAFDAAWTIEASEVLRPALRFCLNDANNPLTPKILIKRDGALYKALAKAFASAPLTALLHERLFGEGRYRALSAYCSQLLKADEKVFQALGRDLYLVRQLGAMLTDEDPAASLQSRLAHIEQCEPFLITVQDSFDLLRSQPGGTITQVAKTLDKYANVIRQRAAQFRKLEDIATNERSREMQTVAAAAFNGVPDFLRAILTHHASVASDRGRDPIALLEGEKIVAPTAPDRSQQKIVERLGNGYPWDNGYYLATAGRLYQQVQEAQHV